LVKAYLTATPLVPTPEYVMWSVYVCGDAVYHSAHISVMLLLLLLRITLSKLRHRKPR